MRSLIPRSHFWIVTGVTLEVSFAAIGPGMAGEKPSSVPLKIRDGGRMIVPVCIQGKGPFDFLLDTGADCTLVDSKLSREVDLRPAPKSRIRTFAGAVEVSQSDIRDVSVGSHSVNDLRVVCGDLQAFFGLPDWIDGILGQDFLSQHNYLLSYRGKRIRFDLGGAVAHTIRGLRMPAERRNGKFYIAASEGGRKLRFLLDSGISYPVMFERPGGEPEADGLIFEGREFMVASSVGRRKLRACRLQSLRLGNMRMGNLQIYLASHLPDETRWEDGILPVSLFEAIFFSNSGNYVVLNPQVER